jgi:hypothetical protein
VAAGRGDAITENLRRVALKLFFFFFFVAASV